MHLGCRVQDQLNTSEPTAPYIIGHELNLRKLPCRQWESNPQPSEQMRPMTIKKLNVILLKHTVRRELHPLRYQCLVEKKEQLWHCIIVIV